MDKEHYPLEIGIVDLHLGLTTPKKQMPLLM